MAFRLMIALLLAALATSYFGIHVIDADTGRGVPLVEVETVNKRRFYTDSNGYVAFDEPGLMRSKVFFFFHSDGYSYPADGFGYEGCSLETDPGAIATVKMKRTNIAERLCRLTGQGIYCDSVLLGKPQPLLNPVLNGGVLGQDTAQAEIYRGKMMWFWGDTDRASYPLGNFHTTGAVATFPKGSTDASRGLDFQYFTGKDGFVKPMVESSDTHPIWISGLAVLGKGPKEELFAYFAQMESLGKIKRSGYLKWNDSKSQFDVETIFPSNDDWHHLDGQTFLQDGYQVGDFPPTVRVPAKAESLLNAGDYQAYSCRDAAGQVVRDQAGKVSYRWQSAAPPITPGDEQKLIDAHKLKPDEAHFLPVDASGEAVFPHGGCVHWNAFRKKWIAIFTRKGGRGSALEDIYYSEADAPTGPFHRAVRILMHRNYTFYNPVHHPFLDQPGGRIIYLEGTYTAEFSGNPNPTPAYNYNQILYRLDLSDPRLSFAKKCYPPR